MNELLTLIEIYNYNEIAFDENPTQGDFSDMQAADERAQDAYGYIIGL